MARDNVNHNKKWQYQNQAAPSITYTTQIGLAKSAKRALTKKNLYIHTQIFKSVEIIKDKRAD